MSGHVHGCTRAVSRRYPRNPGSLALAIEKCAGDLNRLA